MVCQAICKYNLMTSIWSTRLLKVRILSKSLNHSHPSVPYDYNLKYVYFTWLDLIDVTSKT
jgi:hypothetical protein